MHVFVTGGTGLVGRALCGALVARGDEVTALSRTPGRRPMPAGVHVVAGDPAAPGPWQGALARADACVNLAGEPLAEGRWTAERKRLIRASRVGSTRNVADVMRERGPRVLVSGSGINFYGARGEEVLDETSSRGDGFLADVCREWEEAAERAAPRARVTLLRTSPVLAREGGALPKLALPFRLFAGGPLGDGAFYQPWIHIADEVGLILFALDDARAPGPMNAIAPQPIRNREFARTMGKVLGRPSALPAPALAIRVAVGEVADVLLSSVRAVPAKALALGYRFRFPELEGALRDLLR